MRKFFLFLGIIMLFASTVFAAQGCFLVEENGLAIESQGDCNQRYSPASTFKIALALMGFDAGVLKDGMARPERWTRDILSLA